MMSCHTKRGLFGGFYEQHKAKTQINICTKYPGQHLRSLLYLLFHPVTPDNHFSLVYEAKPLDLTEYKYRNWKCFSGKLNNNCLFLYETSKALKKGSKHLWCKYIRRTGLGTPALREFESFWIWIISSSPREDKIFHILFNFNTFSFLARATGRRGKCFLTYILLHKPTFFLHEKAENSPDVVEKLH